MATETSMNMANMGKTMAMATAMATVTSMNMANMAKTMVMATVTSMNMANMGKTMAMATAMATVTSMNMANMAKTMVMVTVTSMNMVITKTMAGRLVADNATRENVPAATALRNIQEHAQAKKRSAVQNFPTNAL